MTTPFPFTAGQVLTAAQMNNISTLVINDKTDSYTLVIGDLGERVIMNKATATTITVPNSVFAAGDMVFIANKGAGTCTITAGAGTTVSTGGSLALTQYAGGTLLALSASSFVFFASNGASTFDWISYTPTLGVATLGNGTISGKYVQIGKFVAVKFIFTLGSTSTMGLSPTITLPVTGVTSNAAYLAPIGWNFCGDTGVTNKFGYVFLDSSTTAIFYLALANVTTLGLDAINTTAPFTWGNTDVLSAYFIYEAA